MPVGTTNHRISWDEVGTRRYKTGLDRGVLYPNYLSRGYPWSGLISVAEDSSRELTPYYTDGVKYLDHDVPGDFSAKLQAFTYPDVFDYLTGLREVDPQYPGVRFHDQPLQAFGLTYRTQIGDDVGGVEAGHIIHILWNLRAIPDGETSNTRSEQTAPDLFGWTLQAVPSPVANGPRPTAHISVDTRELSSSRLQKIEDILYGSTLNFPYLPTMLQFLQLTAEGGLVDS